MKNSKVNKIGLQQFLAMSNFRPSQTKRKGVLTRTNCFRNTEAVIGKSSCIETELCHKKLYILRTDTSGYALDAVLLQGHKKEAHPIKYASRLLNAAEKNYSTTEREALAVVWILKKFHGYIEGQEVTVASDHQQLKCLMSLKSPSGRLAR